MLQNRIASANALLILMILTAKVSCQMGDHFEQASTGDQNQELDQSRSYNRRQPSPKFDLELMRFNQRNTDNYRSVGGSSGGRGGGSIVAIVGGGPPGGALPPNNPSPAFGSMKVKITPQAVTGQESQSGSPVESISGKQSSESSASSSSSSCSGDYTINQKENEEKLHGLQRLIQQLYVAQAQVQLEVNEIQRAQGVAAAAQQSLEETTNNVRIITAALHAAQQTVAAAAIRAQTAQLQLAAHDQLLFAARQRVDALSAQIVSFKAEEGIQPTKMIINMQALLNKLKEPLPDNQKPTPVPSILGEGGGQNTKSGAAAEAQGAAGQGSGEAGQGQGGPGQGQGQGAGGSGQGSGGPGQGSGGPGTETEAPPKEGANGSKMIHSISNEIKDDHLSGKCPCASKIQDELTQNAEQNEDTSKFLLRETPNLQEDNGKIQQKPENEAKDHLGYLMTKDNDLTQYADSFLNDNSDENDVGQVPEDNIKRELSILNEKELRNLVDFITAVHRQDQQQHDLELDNKRVFAKHTDQKYINDFLNTIKTTQLNNQKFQNLKVNEVINKRDHIPEKNMEQNDNAYDTDNEPIFNLEKAFDLNSENFQESLP